ncbi:uncharacterized protein MELLADRAFT_112840 [Melampsora larici-populina 98AG31]|uniref:SET domain-containing protein n=1 Tax=Melampsora larici-populina (strain 98AG31 / pathotype 3-4-7) TaxID=747676 RepID=F4S7V3_MELLP|nr:uncharacterized protein MELLADRAFT_112840 [Melampsora larici-populina 98AG31]EGF99275.1 hypothetical protein MELLADRAFT_112840 [Melampsora larici-populina 98AG31]
MRIRACFLTHFLIHGFVEKCCCNNDLHSNSLPIFIKPESSPYTQQTCVPPSSDQLLPNKVSIDSRHGSSLNSCIPSPDSESSRALKSSVGLVYKFDQVDVKPILESVELDDDLDGFVKQECYPGQDNNNREPVCIYLNYAFDHGRGMVYLATPSVFKAILPNFTVFKPKKDPKAQENLSGKRFEVVDMPHKGGKGTVSLQRFYPGDLIVSDHTVFVSMTEPDVWRREDIGDIMKTAVDYLPFETRATFATLHGEGETQGEWIKSAFERNNFYHVLKVGEYERPFGAVVFEPTRLNHDCRPNAGYHFDTETLQIHVHALRDISLGEELTVAYIGGELLSDYRIEKIQELTTVLDDWKSTSVATPSMAERLVNLYKLERLDVSIHKAYLKASLAYNAIGEWERSRIYAALALASGLVALGPKWAEWPTAMELEQEPETHWSFKARLLKTSS